ncbi:recombinase family protein [Streptomyces sp. NPDC048696]|uniref:recombinase family protein n=1 Tax=Streptomyces sp. NPDC048696 TaxID=3365585 RepID=UPI0037150BEF
MTRAAVLESATDTTRRNARPLRAVIYVRVSQDRLNRQRSVSEQEAECRAVCEREGWTVLPRVFKDNDRSASRYAVKERKDYPELKEFIRDGNADVLVTWESSRAQRDLGAYVELRELCREFGVLWNYKGRTHDLSRTDDQFTTGIDALVDERASAETRDRVLRAKRSCAMKGRPNGRTLFGYRREYDPNTSEYLRQVPHEEQAPVVREVARRLAAGESVHSVMLSLNQRGIPTRAGNRWDWTAVKSMITNPGYIGKRIYQGKVIGDADWPPLLDQETFYAVVARFAQPERKQKREGRYVHLLSGMARCGSCGGRIRTMKSSGQRNYTCYGNDISAKRGCVGIRMGRMDTYIVGLVTARLARPDAADLLCEDRTDELTAALAEAAEKRARLDGFYDQAASGGLSPAALSRIEARLLPEIRTAENRAAALRVSPVLREVIRPDIAEVWPTLELEHQRAVIDALMTIKLHPARKGKGSRTFDPNRFEITWKHEQTAAA